MTEEASRIAGVVEAINRAWLEGRYDAIGDYVHEFVVLSPPGAAPVLGRSAFVQSYADFGAAATLHSFESEQPNVRAWGDTAVAECPYAVDYEIPTGRFKERGVRTCWSSQGSTLSGLVVWRTLSSSPAPDAP